MVGGGGGRRYYDEQLSPNSWMLGNGAHKLNGNTTTTIQKLLRRKRPEETVFESIVKEKGKKFVADLYAKALNESVQRDPTFPSYNAFKNSHFWEHLVRLRVGKELLSCRTHYNQYLIKVLRVTKECRVRKRDAATSARLRRHPTTSVRCARNSSAGLELHK